MAATEKQIQDLAQAISLQAEALADGSVPEGQRWAAAKRLADNVDTLRAWIEDDRNHTL